MMAPTEVWPLPRLALAVAVSEDPRETATFTVTNGKDPAGSLDPGDGTALLDVVLTGGTGTKAHAYADPGHRTYTATVIVPCPVRYADWTALAAAATAWDQVTGLVETWADTDRASESASIDVTVDVGAATIWARAVADPVPRVDVDVWCGDPDTVHHWTVTREAVDVAPVLNTMIYLASDHPSGYSIEDREAPLAVSVRYRLDVTRTDGTTFTTYSAPVVIVGTRGCWLTSAVTGATVPVTVQSWDTRTRTARVTYLQIANRPDPIALSDTHLWPSGQVVFRTDTRQQLDALLSVLLTGLVLLRTQPTSSLRNAYFSVGDFDESRVYPGEGAAWTMTLPVQVQEIAPIPATARASSTSWAQVAASWASWTALALAMPTWQDVGEWRGDVPRPAESAKS
jgi:hypothetical protein